jgi:hypothetical protein
MNEILSDGREGVDHRVAKKILQLFFIQIMCILLIPGCAHAQTVEATTQFKEAKVKGNHTTIYLKPGQTKVLRIKGVTANPKWKSKNKKVAVISNRCYVTALKSGKVTLTAKVKKTKYRCTVVVMKLSKDEVYLKVGSSKKITLKRGGSNVKWTSSNESVAKVSGGKIKAVAPGVATVTAKAHGRKFKCKVRVPSVVFSAIKLRADPENVYATAGMGMSSAKVYTDFFTTKPTFVSTNPSILEVNEDGEIHALRKGHATIKVIGNGLTFKSKIYVIDRPVDVFLSYLNLYSEFIKENAEYVENNSSPTKTFAAAQAQAAKKGKIKVNCRAGITWAFTDMGITTGATNTSHAIYAKNGTFKKRLTGDPLVATNVQNYVTWITEGEVIGKTVKQAVDAGLLKPGDMCAFKGRTHTFTYSGKGYKFYDGGTICEMTGYDEVGLLLDYSTGKSKKYTFDSQDRLISEILRWK